MKLLGDIATNHFLDPETPIPIKTIAFTSLPLEHCVAPTEMLLFGGD